MRGIEREKPEQLIAEREVRGKKRMHGDKSRKILKKEEEYRSFTAVWGTVLEVIIYLPYITPAPTTQTEPSVLKGG